MFVFLCLRARTPAHEEDDQSHSTEQRYHIMLDLTEGAGQKNVGKFRVDVNSAVIK